MLCNSKLPTSKTVAFHTVPENGPSTRLPDADLILAERSPFARHQLFGINVFALEMFDQFRTDLGLFKLDPYLPSTLSEQISSQRTAVAESVLQAQTSTAHVTIVSTTRAGGKLQADVEVQNLAGHNFPSGVSFRRAFLNFEVLDGAGNVPWVSGTATPTASLSITRAIRWLRVFQPGAVELPTTFLDRKSDHLATVKFQIYEELVTTIPGHADNQLPEPRSQGQGQSHPGTGRSLTGPGADIKAPVGTGSDPSYQRGCGCGVVAIKYR